MAYGIVRGSVRRQYRHPLQHHHQPQGVNQLIFADLQLLARDPLPEMAQAQHQFTQPGVIKTQAPGNAAPAAESKTGLLQAVEKLMQILHLGAAHVQLRQKPGRRPANHAQIMLQLPGRIRQSSRHLSSLCCMQPSAQAWKKCGFCFYF